MRAQGTFGDVLKRIRMVWRELEAKLIRPRRSVDPDTQYSLKEGTVRRTFSIWSHSVEKVYLANNHNTAQHR